MSEQAIAAIVRRAVARLDAGLKAMDEDDRGFERTRVEAASFYSERSHALAMAAHIQGLYSQAENLLKQVMEQLGDALRKTEAWQKQLLEIAAAEVPGVRSAILSEEAFSGLASMLRMRHMFRSNYAGDLKPARILEFLPETRLAIGRTISDLSEFANGLVWGIDNASRPPEPAPK
ncbi:hypothetical protein VAR608DRAFT_0560 [Variovorax sp. HW608]|uniref:ribonuclease toxin HepT-like protein n=1 Tax=Variovorax sp. HW608 TaxID=1034889 RepID=UPI0008201779|nr:hypothetical protein [Variovorax sp. HW608]SCK11258.1 hypothetical protein VAR608DRAFT_0560 [Variovorax sp. HW608]